MGMRRLCWLVLVVLGCLVASGVFGAEKGEWICLFNGKNLGGWKLCNPDGRQNWSVVKGLLHNESMHDAGGTDICTVEKFGDCLLHIEFNAPKGGNHGVYLQGRYGVQVNSAIASNPPGEWQIYDILFRQARINEKGEVVKKARISVLHNDKKIIDDVELDGVTGGAPDNKEGTPGPLLLKGNQSSLDYRNIFLSPLDANATIVEPLPPPFLFKPGQPKVYEPVQTKKIS